MKNLLDQVKNYAKTNKKQFTIFSVLGVCIIILIIGLAIGLSGGKSSKKEDKISKEVYQKIEKMKIEEDNVEEINTLIHEYYAALIAADTEKLSALVDKPDIFKGAQLEQSVVEAYNNIKCYTVDGVNKDEFVVFVYWEVKLVNTETLAPGIDTFYVSKENDKYVIHSEISDGEASYINTLTQNTDIKKLFDETNDKFNTAINSDANLKAVYEYFVNSGKQQESQETTTAAK